MRGIYITIFYVVVAPLTMNYSVYQALWTNGASDDRIYYSGMSDFGTNSTRLVPKGTNPKVVQIRFYFILARKAKMY